MSQFFETLEESLVSAAARQNEQLKVEGDLLKVRRRRGSGWATVGLRSRPIFRFGIAAAGLAIAIAVAVQLVGTQGKVSSTASPFDVAAAAAKEQPPLALGPNTYLYTEVLSKNMGTVASADGAGGDGFSTYISSDQERWVNGDGNGESRTATKPSEFASAGDRKKWIAQGRPDVTPVVTNSQSPKISVEKIANQSWSGEFGDLHQIPTDPQKLFEILHQKADRPGGPPVDPETFVLVGDILGNPTAPPELRSALFEASKKIPGVSADVSAKDPAGRSAIEISMVSSGQKTTLFFDPSTSGYVGKSETGLESAKWIGLKPPFLFSSDVVLKSGVVASIGDKP